jgi:hypothetical protein
MTMSHKEFSDAELFAIDIDKTREFHKGVMTNTTQRMLAEVRKLGPDIIWAIWGGGGNFGVVTSMQVQLHETRHMLAGSIVYPLSEAEPVLRRYAAFAMTMPDELGVPLTMTSGPDGQPAIALVPLWNGDKLQRGARYGLPASARQAAARTVRADDLH